MPKLLIQYTILSILVSCHSERDSSRSGARMKSADPNHHAGSTEVDISDKSKANNQSKPSISGQEKNDKLKSPHSKEPDLAKILCEEEDKETEIKDEDLGLAVQDYFSRYDIEVDINDIEVIMNGCSKTQLTQEDGKTLSIYNKKIYLKGNAIGVEYNFHGGDFKLIAPLCNAGTIVSDDGPKELDLENGENELISRMCNRHITYFREQYDNYLKDFFIFQNLYQATNPTANDLPSLRQDLIDDLYLLKSKVSDD